MTQQNWFQQEQTWSFISHELRTPLNSIIGYAQMMMDDTQHRLPEAQLRRVSTILKAGRHLQDLLSRMSRYDSALQDNEIQEQEEIDLLQSVRSAIALIKPIARQKNIVIHNTRSAQSIIIAGSSSALDQIILNLLDNAVKYNRNNGSIAISYEIDRLFVTVSVKDTGIGIPEDQLDHIFKPFYRIKDNKETCTGSGIGLAVVQQFASFLNGTVGVTSSKNDGSMFWFTLPLKNSTS
ncbi:sensor histidine kinase [Paenibacillus sp. CAU 1782]